MNTLQEPLLQNSPHLNPTKPDFIQGDKVLHPTPCEHSLDTDHPQNSGPVPHITILKDHLFPEFTTP